MPEMRLKKAEFTYNACAPFTRNKLRIQKFMEIYARIILNSTN